VDQPVVSTTGSSSADWLAMEAATLSLKAAGLCTVLVMQQAHLLIAGLGLP
jgi:hypothetical protein